MHLKLLQFITFGAILSVVSSLDFGSIFVADVVHDANIHLHGLPILHRNYRDYPFTHGQQINDEVNINISSEIL